MPRELTDYPKTKNKLHWQLTGQLGKFSSVWTVDKVLFTHWNQDFSLNFMIFFLFKGDWHMNNDEW